MLVVLAAFLTFFIVFGVGAFSDEHLEKRWKNGGIIISIAVAAMLLMGPLFYILWHLLSH
ncbi:MAG: hypothetical protein IJ333_02035 [Clostridia bacterium]|nr:hypothetical protein [Clostridia bacterium]